MEEKNKELIIRVSKRIVAVSEPPKLKINKIPVPVGYKPWAGTYSPKSQWEKGVNWALGAMAKKPKTQGQLTIDGFRDRVYDLASRNISFRDYKKKIVPLIIRVEPSQIIRAREISSIAGRKIKRPKDNASIVFWKAVNEVALDLIARWAQGNEDFKRDMQWFAYDEWDKKNENDI